MGTIIGGWGDDARAWNYSYGTFMRVREAIARALGIEDRETYYAGKFTNHTLLGYWVNPETENHMGESVLEPEDDIDFLMLHQDCEGILPPWASARVAARLKDIIVHMSDDSAWDSLRTRQVTVELLDLLEWAGENDCMLHFG